MTRESLDSRLDCSGGCAAIEKQQKRWSSCDSSFTAGRADASQEQTDAESFDVLEPSRRFSYYKS
jgi:catalase (peroxidase I)